MKKLIKKWWFWVIIVLVIGIIGAASSTTEETSNAGDTTHSTEASTTEKPKVENKGYYDINETYSTKKENITITEWEIWTGYMSELITPTEGNIVVRAYVKYKNNSSNNDQYFSEYSFDCYANNKACSIFIWHEDSADFVGGNVGPGREAEGWLYFEIPENFSSLELEYELISLTDDRVIFKLK